jgi:hypothetical protein
VLIAYERASRTIGLSALKGTFSQPGLKHGVCADLQCEMSEKVSDW